jgi:hypothetical protein
MALENIGLDRGSHKPTLIGQNLITVGSDLIEAFAIAMIHATSNAELQERVQSAMNRAQLQKPNLVFKAEGEQTPGRPEFITNITAAAGGVKIIGPNKDSNWKRAQVAIHAEAGNAGNIYIAIATGDIDASDSWLL